MSMLTRGWLFSLALMLVGLSGCQTVQTTRGGVVGVERQQQMLISAKQVDQAASEQYATVLAQARKAGKLNADAQQAQRVRAIAQRLIPHTAVFRDDAVSWSWEINVITAEDVNAWCMPGGKIAVYTGLIDKLSATDNELAAVLGHEIAHALREHARERMSRAAPVALGAQILGAVYGQGVADIGGLFGQAFFVLPNSRENEQESDRIGVELAARAGFDPRAAISLWQKMGRLSNGEPPQFLSTHPSRESRIADLSIYSARVMPLYEKSRAR